MESKRAFARGGIASLAIATAVVWPAASQAPDLDRRIALFARYVDPLRTQLGIPGLSAAIVSGGRIAWESGFGHADVERRIPAAPDTGFGAPTARFQPYVTAGIGTAHVTLKDALNAFTATSSLIAANVGGGVVVATRTRLRVIGDVRYIRSQYGDVGAASVGEEFVSFWRASTGALLRF